MTVRHFFSGTIWHHLRVNLTASLISPSVISNSLDRIESIAEDWSSTISNYFDNSGYIKNLHCFINNLCLEMTCAFILGRRMDFYSSNKETDLANRLNEAVQNMFIGFRDTLFGIPFWKLFPTTAYNKLKKGEEDAYEIVMELIRDEKTQESLIFQSVLQAGIDERDKITAIVDYISGGIFTLSNSLMFLLYYVASSKEAQEKLIEDFESGSMAYAKACVKESFRIMPTANPIARIAEEDLCLSGYHIKQGTVLICHTGIACRNDVNFYKANEFIPERWMESDTKTIPHSASPYLVVPFGAGKRLCPGKRFVELVLPVVLKHIVRKYRMSCSDSLQILNEFLYTPKKPLNILFQLR